MIEKIDAMPPGTIGFRSSGKLTRSDYTEVLQPALREAVNAGSVRMLFELTSLDGLEPAALFEDMKTGLDLGLRHRSAWKKSAIVTDMDWLAKAFRVFAPLAPGEVGIYRLNQHDEAVAWVAA
jgi:hypothetical protein